MKSNAAATFLTGASFDGVCEPDAGDVVAEISEVAGRLAAPVVSESIEMWEVSRMKYTEDCTHDARSLYSM